MREGWREVRLGEVATVVGGGTPRTSVSDYWGGDIVWLTPAEVVAANGKAVCHSDRQITKAGLEKSGATLLPLDTVLLTSRATIGALAIAGCPLATNQGFQSLVPSEAVLPRFLMYWAQANRAEFIRRAGGSTFKEISRSEVRQVPILLPPRDEQRRIVDLIAAVDEAIEAAAISDHAAQSFNQACQDSLEERFAESVPVELGEIAEVKGGITKDSKRQSEPGLVRLPYLRVANVQRGFLDLTDMTELGVTPAKAQELQLQRGDVLLNEGGDRDKLGRGWIWEGQLRTCIHQNHVFRARLRDERFDPYYVAILTNSRAGQRWFEENGSQTTNLASINVNTIRRFPVPALKRSEQQEIVDLHMAARTLSRGAKQESGALRQLRSALLDDLLSGDHAIPASYDELLSA
ncbi:MAG: restriction endonuclease subunit S [Acidimicrobiales bacterium]